MLLVADQCVGTSFSRLVPSRRRPRQQGQFSADAEDKKNRGIMSVAITLSERESLSLRIRGILHVPRKYKRFKTRRYRSGRCGLVELDGLEFEIAVGNRPVIALEHERASGFFVQRFRGAGRARDFDVFVDHFAVVDDFYESGVFGLLAAGIETRG